MESLPQHEATIQQWVDPHQLKNINSVWVKDGRQVITEEAERICEIIWSLHDPPIYGHPGISQTMDFVEQHYWWPGLHKEVSNYVWGCGDCQRHKVNNQPTKAPLQPIYPTTEMKPFEVVAMDFITKLPPSDSYNSILTITNHSCTKMVHFIPCCKVITAKETAQLFLETVFRHYDLPHKIISDWDPWFMSKFLKELCQVLGIQQNLSSTYHPWMDRQFKHNNQWVETYLCFFVNHQQDDWASYLPIAEFTHNNWKSETMKQTPFFLLMGYHPCADGHDAHNGA